MTNIKNILLNGNAAIAEGNYEGFLNHCTDDTKWTFIGERTLHGKNAVRQWMKETYMEPPKVTVDHLIADGDMLVAVGEVTMTDQNGKPTTYCYSDVWRFRDGLMAELRAFVIARDPE